MKKLIFLFIIAFIIQTAKSQNHAIGSGFGLSDFEPPVYFNYQFNYKLLNTKLKASLLPFGMRTTSMSSSYDLYLGISTNAKKRNILRLNAGITFFNPKLSNYEPRIKQQANPIFNFEYSYAFSPNHLITSNLSYSWYITKTHNLNGNDKNYDVFYLIIEIGYAYRFKQRTKEEKPTN